jgi:hypothetical protein
MINEMCLLGTAIRRLIVEHMISRSFYQQMTSSEKQQQPEAATTNIDSKSPHYSAHSVYTNALDSQVAKRIHLPKQFAALATTTSHLSADTTDCSQVAADVLGSIRLGTMLDVQYAYIIYNIIHV